MSSQKESVSIRQPVMDKPFKNEKTKCRCGAPLIRHILPLSKLGGCANVDQIFDKKLGIWVETRIVFHTAEYAYSCSVCHVAEQFCDCGKK